MMLALPLRSTTSWKKSSRLRSLHSAPPEPPLWMQPVWMPLTATEPATVGVAVLAPLTCAKSTSHDALEGTRLGSPDAEVPYQATSTTPGDTTSRVGNTLVPEVEDSVTGALQVAPLVVLYA